MGRSILIIVLGAMISYGITNISLNENTTLGTQGTVDDYSFNRAHDIATSTVEIILMRLANDDTYRVKYPKTEDLFDGYAIYTVKNSFFEGDSLIKIVAAGHFNGVTKTVTSHTKKASGGGWVPPFIRAAWTANANLNRTISNMFIDGRNHALKKDDDDDDKKKKKKKKKKGDDDDYYIIPGSGVYGVSSSVKFKNVSKATIGGTKDSIDYPLSFPENPNVVEEFYNWKGGFPKTPDEVLGYPEGTLKKIAKSGKNGSQYLLNPKRLDKKGKGKGKGLKYPVSGVTYIEITDGKERKLKFFGKGNSGIVIIHGPNRSSRLKEIKYDKKTSDGLLTGLLITDYSFRHKLDILGGVIQLSTKLELKKKSKGNKDHWVYFSSQAISNATGIAAELSGLTGNNTEAGGYGFGQKRMLVKYWYE